MRLHSYTLIAITLGFFACQPQRTDLAQTIVDQAIAIQGGPVIDQATIDFDFRGRHYRAIRDGGTFQYERIFTVDSSGALVRDVLTNEGLTRYINGEVVRLPSKDSAAYSSSVNSVIYYALLPYFLNDPAVQKTYLDSVSIHNQPYHKIKVTFAQTGGGKDYEDEYVYWIHRKNYTMDYLAYNYHTDGGGARFREAYQPRIIAGIRFTDFHNYEPIDQSLDVELFDRMYQQDSMKLLSEIVTENIEVVN